MAKSVSGRPAKRGDFLLAGNAVAPGTRENFDLPITALFTHTPVTMPVQVIHGKREGPVLFVSAALHGDEINGVEIIRRVLELPLLKKIRGTLIAVPIVNVQGFLNHSRYLPDRRDLNRSFPGSKKGSVAGRLADHFLTDIVSVSDFGIDLHTAAIHRENLPQIRADLSDAKTDELARAFGVPVVIDAPVIEGSLRGSAGKPVLVYESGEALRFDEFCIRAGVLGVTNVMRQLDMLPKSRRKQVQVQVADASSWLRAPASGILRAEVSLGQRVTKGEVLGEVADAFGESPVQLVAGYSGIVIGRSNLPLVNEGDALFHIARFAQPKSTEARVGAFEEAIREAEAGDPQLSGEPTSVDQGRD